ncbi:RecQ family ATP-dependent DNA helicase [Calothrix sp. 336/3]|uniref:RecQ family ATP-dependent DNA helicase n=1 Tax=Calothrix sp. 336/3 TaxID=1337936 RepID=UPI0004E3E206|nr:ATP-dependent DNA helicase RecQ [Calothrix sp. 336/3]AKG21665.1 ATP-dependent DNA helicase RecQ [Calothrix sp. 336/3]
MNYSTQISWQTVKSEFQRIWGYQDFRPPQGEIINCLLAKQDALILMPTGGGKSICFQLPALLQTGLTLVVSPLVALMENQVQELRERDLPAALLHSELPSFEKRQILQLIANQKIRLLYLSPETLLSPPVWEKLSHPQIIINGIILDEAHCLVQWGDTFRPTYRRLGVVREALLKTKPPGTKITLAAFTATADPLAQNIIQSTLNLINPVIFRLNPYRENIQPKVSIAWTPQGKKQQLLKFIKARVNTSGLIYVRSRRDSENLAAWLQEMGYVTTGYHAGLGAVERRQIEAKWLSGKMPFVVCTSAFGMGINKADVRWVVHFHAPLLLSEYVQEIGRAGRDGKPADALTLVSEPTGWLDPEDKNRQKFFVDKLRSQYQIATRLSQKVPPTGEVNAIAKEFSDGELALALLHSQGKLQWLDPFHYQIIATDKNQNFSQMQAVKQMRQYLYTRKCRWQFLLDAFGFGEEAKNCGHCDRCCKN